eukprot:jgi/Botrbrau1/6500/Bobra.0034s0073.1
MFLQLNRRFAPGKLPPRSRKLCIISAESADCNLSKNEKTQCHNVNDMTVELASPKGAAVRTLHQSLNPCHHKRKDPVALLTHETLKER